MFRYIYIALLHRCHLCVHRENLVMDYEGGFGSGSRLQAALTTDVQTASEFRSTLQ